MAPLDGRGGRWEVGCTAPATTVRRGRQAALVQTCSVDALCLEKLRYLLVRAARCRSRSEGAPAVAAPCRSRMDVLLEYEVPSLPISDGGERRAGAVREKRTGNVKREDDNLGSAAAPNVAPSGDRHEQSLDPVPSPATMHGLRGVDLFCGIGGLSYGLRRCGIDVVAGYDVDPSCRYAYEANNHGATFLESDIRDLSYGDLEDHYRDADVSILVGCSTLPAVLRPHATEQGARQRLLAARRVLPHRRGRRAAHRLHRERAGPIEARCVR